MEPIHTKALVWVTLAAFVGALYVGGETVSWDWFRALSAPTLVVGAAFWLFDNWLWKFRWFHGWLVKRPNISGKWKVDFLSTWINPDTGLPARSTGTIQVKQTYSVITFLVETPESYGALIGSELIRLPQSRFRFCGSYLNEPKPSVRSQSTMHYGTFLLAIEGPSHCPTRLVGSYWTDRKTTGEMTATRKLATDV